MPASPRRCRGIRTATTTTSQSVNALRLSPAAATTLTIGTGFTQTIVSGGILANGTFAGTITGGTLTAGVLNTANTLFVHQYNTALLTISSVIANNGAGNTVRLVKSGDGTMTLTAANTFTGGTTVNAGQARVGENLNQGGAALAHPALGEREGLGERAFEHMDPDLGDLHGQHQPALSRVAV